MLEMTGVCKRAGHAEHITDVSLQLQRGTVNVLLGPTLSGKTTLMRLMAGLDKPTAGEIKVDGKSVVGTSVRKRNVAMVYQQFINYPGLTVYENIASPLRLLKVKDAELDRKVREAAELLKLEPFLERTPLHLSGGQQQRTAIARALVKNAELVLLDEPLANLDYKLREELRVELPRIFAKTGAVFVYATTEPQEALLLGGKTATLHEGRVTQFGETVGIYHMPADLRTAQTFSDPPFNLAKAQVQQQQLHLLDQCFSINRSLIGDLADGSYTIAVRPHHLSLAATASDAVALDTTVVTSEITGSETFIHVEFGGNRWVLLTGGVHVVTPGGSLRVFARLQDLYFFAQDNSLVRAPEHIREVA